MCHRAQRIGEAKSVQHKFVEDSTIKRNGTQRTISFGQLNTDITVLTSMPERPVMQECVSRYRPRAKRVRFARQKDEQNDQNQEHSCES